MPHSYSFALTLAAALLLAGCNRSERPAETTAAPATVAQPAAPAAAAPTAPPVAVAPADRAATRVTPRDLTLQPESDTTLLAATLAPVPAASPAHLRRAGRTTRAARLHSAATASAGAAAGRWRAVAAPTAAEAAADSASLAELYGQLQASLPPAQTFAVQPGRDTLLVAAQGTQLLVPANAWDVPAGSAPVQLTVREFYRTADLILAGLTTQAGTDLLETGGMLRLEASVAGRPVRLQPGAAVHLRLPTASQQPGMQLFVSPVRAGSDWQLPPPAGQAGAMPPVRPVAAWHLSQPRGGKRNRRYRFRRQRVLPTHFNARYLELPAYPGGQARALKTVARNLAYSTTTQARLRKALRTGRRVSKQEVTELHRATTRYGERVLRLVRVSFQVDTLGGITRLATAPGTDAELARTTQAAVGKLTGWQPALMPRMPAVDSLTAVSAKGSLTAYFTQTGRVHLDDSIRWDRFGTRQLRDSTVRAQMARLNQRRDNYYASLSPQQRRTLDSLAQVRQVAERAALYQRLGTGNNSATDNRDQLYYELSAQQLGWINCDRFLSPAPRIQFVVNAELRNTIATLVFKDMRAVLTASDIGSRTVFDNVPTGQAATVVALRRDKGITYLARHEVTINPAGLGQLTFRPVTPAELQTELASLR